MLTAKIIKTQQVS